MPIEKAYEKSHPIMLAWEKYRSSDDFRNSFKHAADVEHRTGSMWAAFEAGFLAASGQQPNVRLISAAPDLLAALKASVEAHDSHYSHWDEKGTAGANCPACKARFEANALAYAAIAKASEQQPPDEAQKEG
jgi:hypothetical protein